MKLKQLQSGLASVSVLSLSLLSACNGEIRSRAWDPVQLRSAMQSQDGIKGVMGYYEKGAIEIDNLTQLTDKDGKFVTTNCIHVPVQKIVTVPDYEHPVEIYYNHGLLEANKFSVTLANGVFTNVNSESTPDQGKTLANLAQAAGSFAKVAAASVPPGTPPTTAKSYCNAGPTFVGYGVLPHVP